MAKILVTGGPVHASLDTVKIITNKFRGGRMADLAQGLVEIGNDVTYLCSKEAKKPPIYTSGTYTSSGNATSIDLVYHSGYHDYRRRVLEMAPHFDAVVLGAAVVNLIPDNRWMEFTLVGGKFPSHNYLENDPVPILFRIAPRVINGVKRVAPKTVLVGFKLLSGVDDNELIRAAQLTQEESRATIVVANDTVDLDRKIMVTQEGGNYELFNNDCSNLSKEISDLANDEYYSSVPVPTAVKTGKYIEKDIAINIANEYKSKLMTGCQPNGIIFGCVAVRKGDGFIISSRGKFNINDFTYVNNVSHDERLVRYDSDAPKPSLNSPLIDNIFKKRPDVKAVVHWHSSPLYTGVPVCNYSPPATVRDTNRDYIFGDSNCFIIAGHGTYKLLTGEQVNEI